MIVCIANAHWMCKIQQEKETRPIHGGLVQIGERLAPERPLCRQKAAAASTAETRVTRHQTPNTLETCFQRQTRINVSIWFSTDRSTNKRPQSAAASEASTAGPGVTRQQRPEMGHMITAFSRHPHTRQRKADDKSLHLGKFRFWQISGYPAGKKTEHL